MGVDRFDSAVAGLGGCPFAAHKGAAGNVTTEDLVFLCQELGVETGIDLDAMIEAGQLAERVVGHPLPGKLKSGGNLEKYRARARGPRRRCVGAAPCGLTSSSRLRHELIAVWEGRLRPAKERAHTDGPRIACNPTSQLPRAPPYVGRM